MNHLSDEELTQAYYGDEEPESGRHLTECAECHAAFQHLKTTLDELLSETVPERGSDYGAEVWNRLLPRLPLEKPRRVWLRWWTAVPVLASLLAVAFLAGRFTQPKAVGIAPQARQRILLITLGDHLDRSEILLAELVNAGPEATDFGEERSSARDLLDENRLLRQASARMGDASRAAVLDELERALLDIAHSPSQISAPELESLQRRIENEGLLFKVRIISSNIHHKGQQL
jgi:hypothetical protein